MELVVYVTSRLKALLVMYLDFPGVLISNDNWLRAGWMYGTCQLTKGVIEAVRSHDTITAKISHGKHSAVVVVVDGA